MESIIDRILLTVGVGGIKMPWLEGVTGISAARWHDIRNKSYED
jgi:hypothetical protein